MLFEEKKAAYGAPRLSVGVTATIYPCHLRGGESADMTRQVVSTENRGLWQSLGVLNRNKGHLSNTGQAALSRRHQCQKIRHRKLECGPDWVWYPLIQKATLKNIAANELWVAELKCFPWMVLTVVRGASQFLLQGSLCLDLLHDWLLSISWHQSAPLGCLQQSPQWWRKWQRVLTDQNQTPRSLWPDANAQIVLVTPAQWHAHTNSMYVPVN